MKVFVSSTYFCEHNPELLGRLEAMGYEVVRNHYGRRMTEEEVSKEIAAADPVGCIIGTEQYTAQVMDKAPRLKVISRQGVGIDNIDLEAATERGIVVTNTAGTYPEVVAELAFGMMLSLARGITQLDRDVKAGGWNRPEGATLCGKTIGILGTGHIGKALAKRAAAFGMRIVCYSRREDSEILGLGGKYLPLEDVLAQADYVSLHLPMTEQTRGIIGREQLALMKPSAYLINTARGPLVDEEALHEALTEGELAGTGLDVFAEEPTRNRKLVELAKVIATPHIGSHTPESLGAMALTAVENLDAVLKGKRPEMVVNREVQIIKKG